MNNFAVIVVVNISVIVQKIVSLVKIGWVQTISQDLLMLFWKKLTRISKEDSVDKLDILDLLYYGHSCSDCEQELYCAPLNLCCEWRQQTTETELAKELSASMGVPAAYLMGGATKEFANEIDRIVTKRAYELSKQTRAT